jgi:RHS repeat-associated protein
MVSKTQLIDEASTGDSWSYSYDLLNRLVAVVTPETTVSYRYNHLGLRVTKEKSETNESWVYQYGAEQEVVYEEHLEDGNRVELTLKYFVLGKAYAEERVEEGTRYFYHHDHLGSVIALSDESGALVWEGDYNVFGQLDSQKGSVDFGGQYTSKNLDPDTGLYYYNARWMDPDLGRFINEDPARDGQNWYAYVGNNPLSYVDPTGLDDRTIAGHALNLLDFASDENFYQYMFRLNPFQNDASFMNYMLFDSDMWKTQMMSFGFYARAKNSEEKSTFVSFSHELITPRFLNEEVTKPDSAPFVSNVFKNISDEGFFQGLLRLNAYEFDQEDNMLLAHISHGYN